MRRDFGSSWTQHPIYPGFSGYSDLVDLGEGGLGLVFETGKSGPEESIAFVSVPTERLKTDDVRPALGSEPELGGLPRLESDDDNVTPRELLLGQPLWSADGPAAQYVFLRKAFQLPRAPARAALDVTAQPTWCSTGDQPRPLLALLSCQVHQPHRCVLR